MSRKTTLFIQLSLLVILSTLTGHQAVSTGRHLHSETPTAADAVPLDCEAIHELHPDLGNGYYTIDPDGDGSNPPIEAYCDMTTNGGGWTVIDYQHASGWQNYFSSWQTLNSNRTAAPTGLPSHNYWSQWFVPADEDTRFRISPVCQEVSSTFEKSQAYATTGNFYGCTWLNDNCNMNPATQQCYTCMDDYNSTPRQGTCSHLTMSSNQTWNAIYEGYPYSCSTDWWNRAPSLGIAGQYCVAYRNKSFRYKTSQPEEVDFLQPFTYTIGVKNGSGGPQTVNIKDALPAEVSYIENSVSASQGTATYNNNSVTWSGSLASGAELKVSFAVSATCSAPTLIKNQALVTVDNISYTVFAETARLDPQPGDITPGAPSPANNARDVPIDPSPTLSWTGNGVCGTDKDAGDEVAYRVYLRQKEGNWQQVGAYPNCSRSVALPANTLECSNDGSPGNYEWKIEAVAIQNPCQKEPTIKTWNFQTATCKPTVAVKPRFGDYFLTGQQVQNPYRVEVDWNGPARQGNGEDLRKEVHFEVNGKDTVKTGETWGAENIYNMGSDFNASLSGGDNTLRIWAVNSEDYAGEAEVLQPMVFPVPNWITEFAMGGFSIDLKAKTVSYGRGVEYPDPHFKARYAIPGWVPYLGGAEMGIKETYAAVDAEASSDGSGSVEVSGNTGAQISENKEVGGRLFGKGEVQLGLKKGLDLVKATFGLDIKGKIAEEMGIADLVPGLKAAENWWLVGRLIKWFNQRANVEAVIAPKMSIETVFENKDDKLQFTEGAGTGLIDMSLTLTLKIIDALKASLTGGGTPRVVVQVPASGTWGYLKEIALRIYAKATLTVWRFEKEWERGVTCSLPSGTCKGDTGEDLLLRLADKTGWRLMSRDYAGKGYALFTANQSNSARQSSNAAETKIVSRVFPLSDPALAINPANGQKMLLWVHDDTAKPNAQGEEINAAWWNGSSWLTATLTNDHFQDFNPQLAFDASGRAIALWERTNTAAISPTLDITYTTSFEIASAQWDGTSWGSVVTLTNNSLLDMSPQIARSSAGDLMALWRTNDGADLLGVITHPLTLTYAVWDSGSSAWLTPTAALTGLTNILDVDLAVYSATQAALVLARDTDGDLYTGADTEIYYADYNGAGWSSLTRLSTNTLTDTAPSLSYNAAGQPVIVWLQGNDLVMQSGWSGAPAAARAASTSGAFLDFELLPDTSGNLALLWQEIYTEGVNASYAVYDLNNNVWGADNTLMRDEEMEESFAPAFAPDGTLYMAYNKVTMERITVTVDISSTLSISVTNIPNPDYSDLYLLSHSIGRDLAVGGSDISLSSAAPAPGESVVISATVHNRGDLAITNGQVAFYDGDPQAGGTQIGATQTLTSPFRAATTDTVSVSWNIPAGAAAHSVYVVVDPTNAITESNESNNKAALSVIRPDLEAAWTYSVHSTGAVTLTAVISNIGHLTANAPFGIAFRATDPLTGALLGTASVSNSLEVGQAVTATLVLSNPASLAGAGSRYWVIVDEANVVTEENENNNTDYAALNILPDLTLSASDFQVDDAGVLTLTVRNSGVLTAENVILRVWHNTGLTGSLVYSGSAVYTSSVGSIGPGGSAAAGITLSETANLWAKADPDNLIAESNEGNNMAAREIRIETQRYIYLPLVLKNR